MFKSGLRHFTKVSSLVICFQLCFAPLALARIDIRENSWKKAADTVGSLAGMVMGAMNPSNQQMQCSVDPQTESFLQSIVKVQPLTPAEVNPVFRGCKVLPAMGVELTGGFNCREAEPCAVEMGYTYRMKTTAEENRRELEIYSNKGNAQYSDEGLGCYDTKLDDYRAMMAARKEELTAFVNTFTDRIENLTVALNGPNGTRAVPIDEFLDLIKTDEALLTGKPAKFIKDVKFQDYLLGANDQVCKTFLSASAVQQAGSKGLRNIQEDIFKTVNSTQGGNMTADEVLTKAKDIKNEVRTYGRELSKIAKRKDGLEINPSDVTYSSKLSGRIGESLKRVANQFNATMKQELESIIQESDVNQAVAGNKQASEILAGINSGSTNFNKRLDDFERVSKVQCLKDSIIKAQGGSIASFAKSFKNPVVSRRLAKEADSSLANLIMNTIETDGYSMDDIVSKIAVYERKGSNIHKVTRIDNTKLKGICNVNAGSVRPSSLLSCFKSVCTTRFEKLENSDGYSQQKTIQKLREYGTKFTNLKKQAPNKIATLLQDEIVNCPEDTTTGSGALSCNGALNASGANFCVRTAVSCASNMNGCLEKSRQAVKQVADKQQSKVNFLKQTTTELKNNIKRELASLTKFYETQARSLDAQLGLKTVFEMPEGMSFNLNADFSFGGKEAQGLNEEFNLEDPKAMLAHALEKVELLKGALDSHNKKIDEKLTEVKENYIANYQDQMDFWDDAARDCEDRNRAHEEEKARAEEERLAQQEEIDRGCAEIRAFNASNSCDDVGDLASTVQEVSMIAARQSGNASFGDDQQAFQTLGEIRRNCGQLSNTRERRSRSPELSDYVDYCEENRSADRRRCDIITSFTNKNECRDGQFETQASEFLIRESKIVQDNNGQYRVCTSETEGNPCPGTGTKVYDSIDELLDDKRDLSLLAVENVNCRSDVYKDEPQSVSNAMDRIEEDVEEYFEENPGQNNSQLGENVQQISVAACNAQGNGGGGKDYLNIMQDAFQQMNRGAASVQEGGSRNTIPGN